MSLPQRLKNCVDHAKRNFIKKTYISEHQISSICEDLGVPEWPP
jgi:hypothetical protein